MSLLDLPYASGGAAGRTEVKVTAGQFFWSFAPDRVPVGTRVRFDLTSVDVNHGFVLYSPRGHLIGSVQAMPGYHNQLDLTMSEAGIYRIRCGEYCGLNHSTMDGIVHGDPALMEAATATPAPPAILHPQAVAFSGEARRDRTARRLPVRCHRHHAGRRHGCARPADALHAGGR